MTESQSNAIHFLRVFALLSIIFCHLCQYYGNRWAWVLNTGVQVFFVISGYLYGVHDVDCWSKWLKKRVVKLYIPYAIYILSVFPLYYIFYSQYVKSYSIIIYLLDIQGIISSLGGVKGLGHLWFMTAIAVCYAITPLLQWSLKYGRIKYIALLLLILFDIHFLSFKFFYVWLYCFSYLTAHREVCNIRIMFLIIIVSVITYFLQWDDLYKISIIGTLWKCSIAFLLFEVIIYSSQSIEFRKYDIISILSKYSYHIYIVHHLPIMMPFSILAWQMNIIPKLAFLILVVFFSTMLLYVVSNKLIYKFFHSEV